MYEVQSLKWKIEHIYNFKETYWKDGYCHFGFHDRNGLQYAVDHDHHWFGQLNRDDMFAWTAGSMDPRICKKHISIYLKNPMYVTSSPEDGSVLVSGMNNRIYKIYPETNTAVLFINTQKKGMKDTGNCEHDLDGNLWVNEITGCRLWQFDKNGNKKLVLGDENSGFQKEVIPFKKVQFSWIYDIRIGPDGKLNVLDSRNYALRAVDMENEKVIPIAGNGTAGYTGDGGDPLLATFGSDPGAKFDGPYSLSIDEQGNLFIGDTYNHVVRMIERKRNKITTIAGNTQIIPNLRNDPRINDPFKLNIPKICSMDYYNNLLFIPEWDGDLVILRKIN